MMRVLSLIHRETSKPKGEIEMAIKIVKYLKLAKNYLKVEFVDGEEEVNLVFPSGNSERITLKTLESLALLWAEIKKPI